MMDYAKFPNRNIACIDMVSFYASCMASLHSLDVQKVPIAVVGNLERKGSVVLAASPSMKKRFRVKTGTRYGDTDILKAVSLTNPGTSIKRSTLVGGHQG